MTTKIRPFRTEDREAVLAGRNRDQPVHRQTTVAEWERDDARKPAGEISLRFCVSDPPVAYINIVDRETTARRNPGICDFTLWMAQEHQTQGIGSALIAEAARFARTRQLTRLVTWASSSGSNKRELQFLEEQGFVAGERLIPALLDLTTFDRRQFAMPAPPSVRFFSYAETGDTEANRHRLYALALALDRDVPATNHPEPPPFEEFVKHFDRPEWSNDALILAAGGSGEWVGVSQLRFQEHTGIAWTFLTVVLPEYRGLGIALALKLRAIDVAVARNCLLVMTENHESNAPMRAINRKLGFIPGIPSVNYSKVLE